jgi:hypothetical protein
MARYLIKLTDIFTQFAYISYSAVEVGQRLTFITAFNYAKNIQKDEAI